MSLVASSFQHPATAAIHLRIQARALDSLDRLVSAPPTVLRDGVVRLQQAGWTITDIEITRPWEDQRPHGTVNVKFSRWVQIAAAKDSQTCTVLVRQTRYWHRRSETWKAKITVQERTLLDAAGQVLRRVDEQGNVTGPAAADAQAVA